MSVDEPGDLELWSAAAAAYAASVGGDGDSFYRRMRGFLWDRFGDVAGLDVIDLGCGHGWLAEELRVAGGRVTGIDVPEQRWTDYQRWFSRIPTMLAISCVRSPLAEPRM